MMLGIFHLLFLLPYLISASKSNNYVPKEKIEQYLKAINHIDSLLLDDNKNVDKNEKGMKKELYKGSEKNLDDLPLNQIFVDCSDTLVLAKEKLQSIKEKYSELVGVVTQVTEENDALKRKLEALGETKESIQSISSSSEELRAQRANSFGDGYLKHLCADYDKALHYCSKNVTRQLKQISYLKGNLTKCEINITNVITEQKNCIDDLHICKTNSINSVNAINNLNIDITDYKNNITKSNILINNCNIELSNCKSNVKLLKTCTEDLETCRISANSGTVASENLKKCQVNLHAANSLLSTCHVDLSDLKKNTSNLVSNLNICDTSLLTCKNNINNFDNAKKNCQLDLIACKANGYDVSLINKNLIDCKENNTVYKNLLNKCNNNLTDCIKNNAYEIEIINTSNLDLKLCKNDNEKIKSEKLKLQGLLDECIPNATALQINIKKYSELVEKVNSTCRNAVIGLTLERSPEGGLYYFHNNTRKMKTWFGAQDFCRLKGMELVSIETETENEWLKTRSLTFLNNEGHHVKPSFMWTGLHNFENRNYWVWTGTGRNATYTGWTDKKQPHNLHVDRCGNLHWRYSDVKWDNEDCLVKARFICELNKPCSFVF